MFLRILILVCPSFCLLFDHLFHLICSCSFFLSLNFLILLLSFFIISVLLFFISPGRSPLSAFPFFSLYLSYRLHPSPHNFLLFACSIWFRICRMCLQTQYSSCQNVLTNSALRVPECPYKPSIQDARISLQKPVFRLPECHYIQAASFKRSSKF
jgi:hypothetical protein